MPAGPSLYYLPGEQLGSWLLPLCLLLRSPLVLQGCVGGLRGEGLALLPSCKLCQGRRGRLRRGCICRGALLRPQLDYLLAHALHLLPHVADSLHELG